LVALLIIYGVTDLGCLKFFLRGIGRLDRSYDGKLFQHFRPAEFRALERPLAPRAERDRAGSARKSGVPLSFAPSGEDTRVSTSDPPSVEENTGRLSASHSSTSSRCTVNPSKPAFGFCGTFSMALRKYANRTTTAAFHRYVNSKVLAKVCRAAIDYLLPDGRWNDRVRRGGTWDREFNPGVFEDR
jgi:hypothetical protein